MQVGIDSFAAFHVDTKKSISSSERLQRLVEQIEYADQIGLDVFGVGEHHRHGFLDSAPAVILGAAAARTKHIRLTSNGIECSRSRKDIPRIRNFGSFVWR
jgi:alkanesulfonate monooxygenase SsuD/methylene tetrahydromethanopterin reductase-like flavin-dependent oxidoreductase (luciferase family)